MSRAVADRRICARCKKEEPSKYHFRVCKYSRARGGLCYSCQLELITAHWLTAAEVFDSNAPGFLQTAKGSYDRSEQLKWGEKKVEWPVGCDFNDNFDSGSKETLTFEEFLGCYAKSVLEQYFYSYFRDIKPEPWKLLNRLFIEFLEDSARAHTKIKADAFETLSTLFVGMTGESPHFLEHLEPGFLAKSDWDDQCIDESETEQGDEELEREDAERQYRRRHYPLDEWYEQMQTIKEAKGKPGAKTPEDHGAEPWEENDRTLAAFGIRSDCWLSAAPVPRKEPPIKVEDVEEDFVGVRTSLYLASLQYYDSTFMPDEKRLSSGTLRDYVSAYADLQYEYAQMELAVINGALVPWHRIAKDQRDYSHELMKNGPEPFRDVRQRNRSVKRSLDHLRDERCNYEDVQIIYTNWLFKKNEQTTYTLLSAIKENIRKHINTYLSLGANTKRMWDYIDKLPAGGTFSDMQELLDTYSDETDDDTVGYDELFTQIVEPVRRYSDKYRALIEKFGIIQHSKPNEYDDLFETVFFNESLISLHDVWSKKHKSLDYDLVLYERNESIFIRHEDDTDYELFTEAVETADTYWFEQMLVAAACEGAESLALMRESIRILEELYWYLCRRGHDELRKVRVRSLRQDIEDLVFDISCIEKIEDDEKGREAEFQKRRADQAEEANARMLMHINVVLSMTSVEEIVDRKAAFVADMRQMGCAPEQSEELINEIVDRLNELIRAKTDFQNTLKKTETLLSEASEVRLDSEAVKALATAEYMYQEYVVEKRDEAMDYSLIAMPYYRVLEASLNQLVYSGYRESRLESPAYKKSIIENDGRDYLPYNSLKQFYWEKRGQYAAKDTCTLGQLERLFLDTRQLPGFQEYLSEIFRSESIVADAEKIGEDLRQITRRRNAAAHSNGSSSADSAVKARKDVVTGDLGIADVCRMRGLLLRLMALCR